MRSEGPAQHLFTQEDTVGGGGAKGQGKRDRDAPLGGAEQLSSAASLLSSRGDGVSKERYLMLN